jgi:murein DD-endopeptidase MepM/ murein hydrolase activator NlpD
LTFNLEFWYTAEVNLRESRRFFLIMKTDWKSWIYQKAETVIKTAATPLPVKEVAFQAVRFAVACGKSHPVSFALRPIVMHRHLRLAVGLNLILIAVATAVLSPFPTLAQNTGGAYLAVAPEGEINLVTKPGVVVPVENYVITQRFWLLHSGLDMSVPLGTPVKPIMKGRVKQAERNWFGYGNMVVVEHGKDFESLYGHLSKINVQVGDEVNTETIIGLSGSTGHSTGPHLHLEIHQDGKAINPAPILGI